MLKGKCGIQLLPQKNKEDPNLSHYKSLYIFSIPYVLITPSSPPFTIVITGANCRSSMFPSTRAIPTFLLLTFIYILSVFFRCNNHSKDSRKRPPGPLALPIIGNIHLLGTLQHRNLQSLANKYGPIMSLWLIIAIVGSSSEAAEKFLKTHDPTFAC